MLPHAAAAQPEPLIASPEHELDFTASHDKPDWVRQTEHSLGGLAWHVQHAEKPSTRPPSMPLPASPPRLGAAPSGMASAPALPTAPPPRSPHAIKRITIHPDDVETEDIANSIEAKPLLLKSLVSTSRDHKSLPALDTNIESVAKLDDLAIRYGEVVAVQPHNVVALNNLAAALGYKAFMVKRLRASHREADVASVDLPGLVATATATIERSLAELREASKPVPVDMIINHGFLHYMASTMASSQLDVARHLDTAEASFESIIDHDRACFGTRFVYGRVLFAKASKAKPGVQRVNALAIVLKYFVSIAPSTPLHLGVFREWLDLAPALAAAIGRGAAARELLETMLDSVSRVLAAFQFCTHEKAFWMLGKFYSMRAVLALDAKNKHKWKCLKEESRTVASVLPQFIGNARYIGFLYKRGGVRKNFKKRMFVLIVPTDSTPISHIKLSYYEPVTSVTKPKGVIPMAEASEVAPTSDASLEGKLGVARGSCFTLVTVSRTYTLVAPTPDMAAQWVAVLQSVIDQDYASYSPPKVSTAETPSVFHILEPDVEPATMTASSSPPEAAAAVAAVPAPAGPSSQA
ncbi:uncharacterized protein AMSG_10331 [Thecamonas trahens ATCC 50062]|uniref:PH domain-containing protein n=1 Tax=Thecamonas trahens ATCC 50062 TaxID=461836 RepID=A0A0L0DPZ5_THETB|nr:hypothetical protein AMSG_10331 [Thecamonas trahens ATCC 50062]KNC54340.1 hypothetical protein AMSG_10331 [Thecamonas trahens ATCC 50062]|eukprot:XP_013753796.1 hypothetical protein AMSG_10331 [Thecamonas trahens ATCC 50062]